MNWVICLAFVATFVVIMYVFYFALGAMLDPSTLE
jgi:hypothetical protein